MVCLGVLSEKEARAATQWDIYVGVASAFGIGTALINSGLAAIIADFMVPIGMGIGIGDTGLIGAVYLATAFVTNFVANNAAAALIFPIALEAADTAGTDPVLMGFTVMFGASACFVSPFGYAPNLMVFRPGGYTTVDFVRFGFPMQVFQFFLTTFILSVIRPWYWSWIWVFTVSLCSIMLQQVIAHLELRSTRRRPPTLAPMNGVQSPRFGRSSDQSPVHGLDMLRRWPTCTLGS